MAGIIEAGYRSGASNQDIIDVAADGTVTFLTDGSVDWQWVQYTADRSELILYHKPSSTYEVWRMNLDGSGLTKIIDVATSVSWPAIWVDNFYGTSSSFKFLYLGPNSDTLRVTTDGTTSTVLFTIAAFPGATSFYMPTWSPDGTKFAFIVSGWAAEPRDRLYIANADGSGLVACPTTGSITTFDLEWLPDNSGFYYIGAASADHLDAPGLHIWFAAADGSTLTHIYNSSPDTINQNLQLAPDSSRIAYQTVNDVHVINPDGSGHINLTAGTLADVHNEMSWRLDSTQIAVNSEVASLDRVVLIDVPSGAQTVLFAGGTFDMYLSGLLDYDAVSAAVSRISDIPQWRFIIANTSARTLSLLDGRSTDRQVMYALNAPATHNGAVPTDDPEINLPFPDPDSPALLSHNTRFIYGFRREPGHDPPWVVRFAGLVMSLDDTGADAPTAQYTAYDPWQYLFNRPARDEFTTSGDLIGPDGVEYPAGSRASDIAYNLLALTDSVDGPTFIDFSDMSLIEATDTIATAFTIEAGMSVAEVWNQLVETGMIDIWLEPIYDPLGNPGMLCKLHIYKQKGSVRTSAVMAWDGGGNSLSTINRQVDGTRLANRVQYFDGNGAPITLQSDTTSISTYGEYWAQQHFPGIDNAALIELAAYADLLIRRDGQRTVSFDPTPEMTLMSLRDYELGDYVPVWASRNFREPMGVDYDAYLSAPDFPGAAGYHRITAIPIDIDDNGVERVRGLITAEETQSGFSPEPPSSGSSYTDKMAELAAAHPGSLLGYWRLGEATSPFADTSGHANGPADAVDVGSGAAISILTIGALTSGDDGAVQFNAGHYLHAPDPSPSPGVRRFNLENQSCTFVAWVNPQTDSGTFTGGIVSQWLDAGFGNCGWILAINWPARTPFFTRRTTGTPATVATVTGAALTVGEWALVVATYDIAAGHKLYVNGSLVASNPAVFSTSATFNSGPDLGLGVAVSKAGIDEVSIWGVALTAGEIADLYVAGSV